MLERIQHIPDVGALARLVRLRTMTHDSAHARWVRSRAFTMGALARHHNMHRIHSRHGHMCRIDRKVREQHRHATPLGMTNGMIRHPDAGITNATISFKRERAEMPSPC